MKMCKICHKTPTLKILFGMTVLFRSQGKKNIVREKYTPKSGIRRAFAVAMALLPRLDSYTSIIGKRRVREHNGPYNAAPSAPRREHTRVANRLLSTQIHLLAYWHIAAFSPQKVTHREKDAQYRWWPNLKKLDVPAVPEGNTHFQHADRHEEVSRESNMLRVYHKRSRPDRWRQLFGDTMIVGDDSTTRIAQATAVASRDSRCYPTPATRLSPRNLPSPML